MNGPAPATANTAASKPERAVPPIQYGRQVAIYAGVVFSLTLVIGVFSASGLTVPERDTSIGGLLTILRSNLVLLAVLGACAGLQRFARQEVEDGKPPWIRRTTDLVVAAFITLNVGAVGFALGQLHGDALVRILPHAWLEIPAFAVGVAGYLLARTGSLTRPLAIRIYGLAAALLIVAAPIEAFVTGSI